jgi:hypothetical protein
MHYHYSTAITQYSPSPGAVSPPLVEIRAQTRSLSVKKRQYLEVL